MIAKRRSLPKSCIFLVTFSLALVVGYGRSIAGYVGGYDAACFNFVKDGGLYAQAVACSNGCRASACTTRCWAPFYRCQCEHPPEHPHGNPLCTQAQMLETQRVKHNFEFRHDLLFELCSVGQLQPIAQQAVS
jgi:hypothetical protein